MLTYAKGLELATELLEQAGIQEAMVNARELLFYICNLDFQSYILNKHRFCSDAEYQQFMILIRRRAEHTPLQYLTNLQTFCGLDFYVDESVLIPRLDTEVLVEYILQNEVEVGSGLDMCTGSGCIAISLKKLAKFKNITAVDISDKVLQIAKKNASSHQVEIDFFLSDMFSRVPSDKYDFIVSNPPYIRSDVVEELELEVKEHEPRLALDGKADGLKFYRILANEGRRYLKENGRIYLEIGYDQASSVRDLLLKHGFYDIRIIKDLAEKDRVIAGKLGL